MCLMGSPGGSEDAAAQARAAEEAREAAVNQGRKRIDSTFEQFDDSYFDRIRQAALEFWNPQATQQFRDARENTIFGLARAGNIDASAGSRRLGNLEQLFQQRRAEIADRARGAATKARTDVENARSELYAQNVAAANPSAAASSAISRADLLSQPQQFDGLGELFAEFTAQGRNAAAAEAEGFPGTGTGIFAPKKRSSYTIVES